MRPVEKIYHSSIGPMPIGIEFIMIDTAADKSSNGLFPGIAFDVVMPPVVKSMKALAILCFQTLPNHHRPLFFVNIERN